MAISIFAAPPTMWNLRDCREPATAPTWPIQRRRSIACRQVPGRPASSRQSLGYRRQAGRVGISWRRIRLQPGRQSVRAGQRRTERFNCSIFTRSEWSKRIPVKPPSEVVRFDPHGHLLAVCNRQIADVRIIDIESAKVVKTFHHPREVFSLNWNSTGNLLACACFDYRGYVWDVRIRGKACRANGSSSRSSWASFSATRARSWPRVAGTRRRGFGTIGRGASSCRPAARLLAFSADDRRLAFRNQSGWVADEVRVFEFASGDECRTLQEIGAREKGPNHLDISPDNRLLLSCGPDGARLWDTATAEQLAVCMKSTRSLGYNSAVMFHPDGTSVLSKHEGWRLSLADQTSPRRGPPSCEALVRRNSCPLCEERDQLLSIGPDVIWQRFVDNEAYVIALGPSFSTRAAVRTCRNDADCHQSRRQVGGDRHLARARRCLVGREKRPKSSRSIPRSHECDGCLQPGRQMAGLRC